MLNKYMKELMRHSQYMTTYFLIANKLIGHESSKLAIEKSWIDATRTKRHHEEKEMKNIQEVLYQINKTIWI